MLTQRSATRYIVRMKVRRVPNPTNVRFDDGTKSLLERMADEYGVTPSDLIRAAVREKLRVWQSEGVVLVARNLTRCEATS